MKAKNPSWYIAHLKLSYEKLAITLFSIHESVSPKAFFFSYKWRVTDTWISDDRNFTIKIYCESFASRLPVFPERLSAIQAFATTNRERKRGETGQTGGVSTVKTKCKMPVGKRFIGLNLALIYLFDNTGCFKRRPPYVGYGENFKRLKTELGKACHPSQKCLILCRYVTPRCILGSRICQRLWSLEDRRACSEQALQLGHTVLAW